MSVNQFHRFTYFFQTDDEKVESFFDSGEWKNLSEEIGAEQILDLKIYGLENDYFLLVDSKTGMNNDDVQDVLKGKPAFKTLTEILDANGLFTTNPLERIYELEQKVEYAPEQGQLKKEIGDYKRFVWALLLEEDPELMAEYKRVHSIGMAWPEITNNMKSVGVKDMEIYLHQTRAILIMDAIPGFDMDEVGPKWQQLPRETEWQEYVAKFQRTDPDSSIQERWKDMIDLSKN